MTPAITVLMPAYNAEPFIAEAIASILVQTFSDFELLVIDDGSTDATLGVVRSFSDPRIRIVRQGQNAGLIATLNRGLELAQGRYLARMDADDISLPLRFERQYRLMEAQPEVVACSGWSVDFGPTIRNRFNFREADHETLLGRLFIEPPLSHPAAFIRRSALVDSGIRYDPRYRHCEDYRLWCELAKVGRLSNVQELVLRYRVVGSSVSQRFLGEQLAAARRLRREVIEDFFQRHGLGESLPATITLDYVRRFQRRHARPSADLEARAAAVLSRQLNFLTCCLYMSLADYGPASLLHFLLSGDWLRYGIRGTWAAKIVVRHFRPSRFAALL